MTARLGQNDIDYGWLQMRATQQSRRQYQIHSLDSDLPSSYLFIRLDSKFSCRHFRHESTMLTSSELDTKSVSDMQEPTFALPRGKNLPEATAACHTIGHGVSARGITTLDSTDICLGTKRFPIPYIRFGGFQKAYQYPQLRFRYHASNW